MCRKPGMKITKVTIKTINANIVSAKYNGIRPTEIPTKSPKTPTKSSKTPVKQILY